MVPGTRRYDGDLTLFSPEGRLYQVEYVMKAVGQYGCPAVGVHGDDCCVVACKRDLPVTASFHVPGYAVAVMA